MEKNWEQERQCVEAEHKVMALMRMSGSYGPSNNAGGHGTAIGETEASRGRSDFGQVLAEDVQAQASKRV